MRISFTHLILASAAVAAPVHDVDRKGKTGNDGLLSRGLFSLLPRVFIEPVHPVVAPHPAPAHPAPVHPVEPVEPVRPPTGHPDGTVPPPNGAEPVRLNPNDPPVSHDPNEPAAPPRLDGSEPPPKNPNEPAERPPRLGENPPPKTPVEAGPSCGLNWEPCMGAKPELQIDANYDRKVLGGEKPPQYDYIKDAGLNPDGAKWYKTTIDNGPDARTAYENNVLPEMQEKLAPGKPGSPFDRFGESADDMYEYFLQNERLQFGFLQGEPAPFIVTSNNHGNNPSLIVEQMFKDRDLYNGCKECEFADIKFERLPVPRNKAKKVYPSEEIADNWRVSAKLAGVDPKNINNFGMNNIATPKSQDIFKGLFQGEEKVKTFKRNEPGFDEVEKTVQAELINRLLSTEQDTFGNKQVTEHTVYKVSSIEWHMVSKVADV